MNSTFTPIPIFFNSRRAGALRVREAVARAINPEQHIRIDDIGTLLHTFKAFRASAQETTNRPEVPLHVAVPINFSPNHIKAATSRLIAAVTPGYSINILKASVFAVGIDLQVLHPFMYNAIMGRKKLVVVGMPTLVDEPSLLKARAAIPNPARPGRDLVTICIGGDISVGFRYQYSITEAIKLERLVDQVSKVGNFDFVATTSARTSQEVVDYFRQTLAPRCLDFFVHGEAPGQQNPLMPWMAHAKRLVVTADSMSMISEAVDTGRPVLVPEPSDELRGDTWNFYNDLKCRGYIAIEVAPGPHVSLGPLRAAQKIATVAHEEMQKKWPTRSMVL